MPLLSVRLIYYRLASGISIRSSFYRYYHCARHRPRRSKACSQADSSGATTRYLLGSVLSAMVFQTPNSAALDQPCIFLYPYSWHDLFLGSFVLPYYQSKASSKDWPGTKRLCLGWSCIIRSQTPDDGYVQLDCLCCVHSLAVHAPSTVERSNL